MKVKRLPIDRGPAGWNAILPEAEPYPPLDGVQTADWLIVGAGFAGLAATRRLRQLCPNDRCVLLEASRVAHGPSGRNSGFMIDLPHNIASDDYGGALEQDRKQTRMNRAAIDFAEAAAQGYGLIAEAFSRSGKLNAAATDKGMHHNLDYAAHLTALGEGYELLDAAAMKDLTGIDYYQGGLFTPKAAMIQPALFVRGVAAGVTRSGAELFERSPVIALERDGLDWRADTPEGSVTAPKVILAVNDHAESFGFFGRRLMHVFTYASMTRALSDSEVQSLGGAPIWSCLPSDPMGTTVRRITGTGGARIVVRNRFTYDPSMEISEGRIAAVAKDHDRAFAARFPMLSSVSMEFRWGGRLCLARNNAPAFGELEPGLYSACCQNGLGSSKGTLSGMLAAELAAGERSDLLDEMEREPSPVRLPPEPFAWMGANAVIRWNERKAGKEL